MKPISISLTPNTEKDDVRLALGLIFQPWKWKNGRAIGQIEEKLEQYLGVKHAISFNSGRTSLMAILSSLGLEKNSEVLLQAFTCNAAANPMIWSGFKPVYIDCDENTFDINIDDLKAKISPQARVLMVQHTFGLPADMDEIRAICEQYKLILIEDCAHSLGAEFKGKKTGTFGKASFFSFGRDKIISSVWGGVAVTNDDDLARRIKEFQNKIQNPSSFWIFQQLLHPVLMSYIILPLYNVIDLGKIFLVLSQWLGVLSKAVSWKEKRGEKPSHFPVRLPNALAILALKQFDKLDRFYSHRKSISDFYYQQLKNTSFILPKEFADRKNALLRFTVKHSKAHEIIYEAWHKQNILVGDWYVTPIIPHDTDLKSIGYIMGMCPVAERLSKVTLNLPTHINISQKDAEKIVGFLKKFDK